VARPPDGLKSPHTGGDGVENMRRRRWLLLAGSILPLCLVALPQLLDVRTAAEAIPTQLSDQEFWKLSTEFSEPDGRFRSDNLLSNEVWLQNVIPDLVKRAKTGRVYLGVGPEQNFTYMTAMKPAMAFIFDIRRGNLDLQLMYKALFELSDDRAEFVSRLFSRKRPEGLTDRSTADEIFEAFETVDRSEALYEENLKAIRDQLVGKHGFALADIDQSGIDYVYRAFSTFGPRIQYSSTGTGFYGGGRQPTYADLMTSRGADDVPRSYLSNEGSFRFLKDLQKRNLVVPVVGNFAGPKAIRAVAQYLKDKGATVSAFYLSNVEMYLQQDGIWGDFCANVAALPLDETSTFIRSLRGGRYGRGFGLDSQLGYMAAEVETCPVSRR
jgi:hypothetical protein